MFSDVSAFFYKYVGGILPTAPGYREILLRPAINCGIAEVECRVKTVLGTVECSHMAQEDGVAIHIAVPHGATATLVLPHETNRVLAPGTYDFLTH